MTLNTASTIIETTNGLRSGALAPSNTQHNMHHPFMKPLTTKGCDKKLTRQIAPLLVLISAIAFIQ